MIVFTEAARRAERPVLTPALSFLYDAQQVQVVAVAAEDDAEVAGVKFVQCRHTGARRNYATSAAPPFPCPQFAIDCISDAYLCHGV